MQERKDISDGRLAQILGEAVSEMPSAEETMAAWDAFEKKHSGAFVKRYSKARVISVMAINVAVAASLILFFFAPSREVSAPAKSPLELYSETISPMQVEQKVQGGRCVVSTPAATTILVTLEDGTKVTLNANSTLEYPISFSDASKREVRLQGEAHFEVTKNPHHPFVVQVGEMQTQVLGTVFDVKAYRAESPKVTLMEGRVRVSNADMSVDMTPGQTAQVLTDKIVISKSTLSSASDWLEGNFDMEKVSLAEAMGDIGAWYNKTVIFKSRKNMDKQIHFRFSRKAKLEEIIAALNELRVAKIELKDGKVLVE